MGQFVLGIDEDTKHLCPNFIVVSQIVLGPNIPAAGEVIKVEDLYRLT